MVSGQFRGVVAIGTEAGNDTAAGCAGFECGAD